MKLVFLDHPGYIVQLTDGQNQLESTIKIYPQFLKKLVFIPGQRGAPKFVIGGYSYVKNKGSNESTYWRCSKMRSKNCKAKVVINKTERKIYVTFAQHTHVADCLSLAGVE
jgi:hypothetical protein